MSFDQPNPYQSPYPEPKPREQRPASALATISIITGLCSLLPLPFFCCCGLLIIPVMGAGSLTAVFTGHFALAQFKQNPGKESGYELAVIGLIAGYIALVITTVMTLLFTMGGIYSAYERSH